MSSFDQIPDASADYLAAGELVPVGYKKTEVGVIPEDWLVQKLGDFSTVASGGTPDRERKEYWNGDVPWVTTTLINGGEISETEEQITKLALACSSAKWFNPGTLLMAMYGQGKTRGKVAILTIGAATNQACAAIQIKQKVRADFLLHFLNKQYSQIRELSNTGGQENLSGQIVKSILVPVPPKEEQTAIARVLSDVDELINSLEKLTAKKQAIKTATMQQLLTGKTRLPAFAFRDDGTRKGYKNSELGKIPEDWEVFRFNHNFNIYAGGDVPKDSFSDIKTDKFPYPIFANSTRKGGLYGYTGCKRSAPDSLTITARGYLGQAEYRDEYFFPIVRLLVLEPTGRLDSKYTTYAINDRVEFSIESTGVPQLTAPQVGRYSISAPSKIREQTAIAAILSDMDTEVETLEKQLSKARQIKEGMMQELLTGKTRLVKPEAV